MKKQLREKCISITVDWNKNNADLVNEIGAKNEKNRAEYCQKFRSGLWSIEYNVSRIE